MFRDKLDFYNDLEKFDFFISKSKTLFVDEGFGD